MSRESNASGDVLVPPSWPIQDEDIRAVLDAMYLDGSWGRYHGPHCEALRDALREFHNVEHVRLSCSGTSAVELALRAANVGPGDEIILAAYDYKANFANILAHGATPVLIDTLPELPAPDPALLNEAVTIKTKAVICSHLHGSVAAIDEFQSVAKQHDVPVIEDACQSPGAIIGGRVAGSIGDIGILSFGGSKLLTAGRGGAVLTNNATYAQRIRLYTERGNDAYPLSEMQAAVLLPQLAKLHDRNVTRHARVSRILQRLPADGPIRSSLTEVTDDDLPSYYKVAFYLAENDDGLTRDTLAERARSNGIALDAAFPALHKIHSQRRFRAVGELPNASALHHNLLTLHHPILLDEPAMVDNMIDRLTVLAAGK